MGRKLLHSFWCNSDSLSTSSVSEVVSRSKEKRGRGGGGGRGSGFETISETELFGGGLGSRPFLKLLRIIRSI